MNTSPRNEFNRDKKLLICSHREQLSAFHKANKILSIAMPYSRFLRMFASWLVTHSSRDYIFFSLILSRHEEIPEATTKYNSSLSFRLLIIERLERANGSVCEPLNESSVMDEICQKYK